MKRAHRYIKFRRNSKICLASRFHYSMGGGYSTVGFHCYLFTIHQTDGTSRQLGFASVPQANHRSQSVTGLPPCDQTLEWVLTSPNSWSASPCSEDGQPDRRADQGGARGIYNGTLAVSGAHFLYSESY